MGESSTKILNLSESALNMLKKLDLVQKILDIKRKVVINADLHKLCEKTERPTEIMNQIVAAQLLWLEMAHKRKKALYNIEKHS